VFQARLWLSFSNYKWIGIKDHSKYEGKPIQIFCNMEIIVCWFGSSISSTQHLDILAEGEMFTWLVGMKLEMAMQNHNAMVLEALGSDLQHSALVIYADLFVISLRRCHRPEPSEEP
jgi:hypothetical protein